MELKPVKSVTADANLKRFHHKVSNATAKETTLNMGGTNQNLDRILFLFNQTVGEHQKSVEEVDIVILQLWLHDINISF